LKENNMVPGITDTGCRIAQSRSQELQAEAARQHQAAHAAPIHADRVGVMETMRRHIGALMEQTHRVLKDVPTSEGTEHAAPGALAVSK
jgi:hypothetical protein